MTVAYRTTALACAVLSIAMPVSVWAVVPDLRLVALNSQPMSGLPAEARVEVFSAPMLDAHGRPAFGATLLRGVGGAHFENDSAKWYEAAANDLRLIAREGEQVLSLDYRFKDLNIDTWMSSRGELHFLSGLDNDGDAGPESAGLSRYSPSAGLTLMVVSDPVDEPSIPSIGAGKQFLSFVDVNGVGDVAMHTLDGSLNVLWMLDSSHGLTQITQNGRFPKLNDFGDVVYRASGPNLISRLEVWNRSAGTRIVAAEGTMAPGTEGALFRSRSFQGNFDNATGPVSFVAELQGTGVAQDNDFGFWSEMGRGGPLNLVIREGDQAPGVATGVVWNGFDQFSMPISSGRSGGVALRLGLSGPGVDASNDSGIWAGTLASGFHLVAREGDRAPGTEEGTVFSQFHNASVTPSGRSAFYATLSGPLVPAGENYGIWAEDLDGTLKLIVRPGDVIETPAGITLRMDSIQWNPEFAMSERGHIGISADFLAGVRGVFVSSLVAVPEPTSVALVMYIGVCGCVLRARIRRSCARRCRR